MKQARNFGILAVFDLLYLQPVPQNNKKETEHSGDRLIPMRSFASRSVHSEVRNSLCSQYKATNVSCGKPSVEATSAGHLKVPFDGKPPYSLQEVRRVCERCKTVPPLYNAATSCHAAAHRQRRAASGHSGESGESGEQRNQCLRPQLPQRRAAESTSTATAATAARAASDGINSYIQQRAAE